MELGGDADGADGDGRPSCFIGLTQTNAGEDSWSWDDGSEVNYINWGRARRLVGDYEAVTINGNWTVGGMLTFIPIGANVIVMCGSTFLLLYAARARDATLFKVALGGDAVCSVMCIAALLIWGFGNSIKDPARNIPVIILCGVQEAILLSILCTQFWCAGLQPNWHVNTLPIASHVQSGCAFVQPQTVPPRER